MSVAAAVICPELITLTYREKGSANGGLLVSCEFVADETEDDGGFAYGCLAQEDELGLEWFR